MLVTQSTVGRWLKYLISAKCIYNLRSEQFAFVKTSPVWPSMWLIWTDLRSVFNGPHPMRCNEEKQSRSNIFCIIGSNVAPLHYGVSETDCSVLSMRKHDMAEERNHIVVLCKLVRSFLWTGQRSRCQSNTICPLQLWECGCVFCSFIYLFS